MLAKVLSASQHDAELRDAAREAIGAPHSSLFAQVLSRAVERGIVAEEIDIETLREIFPAIAYQRRAAMGLRIRERDVIRVIDGVLLPALGCRDMVAPPTVEAAPPPRRPRRRRA